MSRLALRTLRVVAASALVLAVAAFAASGILALRGERLVVVTGGSMEPAFGAGDALIVGPAHADDYRPGDAVTFRSPSGTVITHRVVAVEVLANGPHLQTRGDANPDVDPDLVPLANVVGVVGPVITNGGTAFGLLSSPIGMLAILGPALLVLLLDESRVLMAWWREDRRGPAVVPS